MSKIHGKNLVVYVDGVRVGDSRDCTLNVNQNLVEAGSKDDANWSVKLAGVRDWSVDVSYLHDESNLVDGVSLIDLLLNATQATVEFTTADSDYAATFWYGETFASTGSLSAPLDDVVSGSITFVGTGALAKGTITSSSDYA